MPNMNEAVVLNNKKVIIIEDDPDISSFIAYNLSKEGFVVQQVFDGLSAAQRIKDEVFDIIILDIMLPYVDGFQICKQIEEDPRYYRSFTVVVTAKSRVQDKLYANLLGADYYLVKPFNLTNLLNTIKEFSRMREREYLVKK